MSGQKQSNRRGRGFKRAANLVQARVQKASASRGFAVSKLLTQWSEIAGQDFAEMARPVDITYGRDGLGATLTVLTTGAQAPMLSMQLEKLREKVNACYGYQAISRVRITQTAATGFAEGRPDFTPAPTQDRKANIDPAIKARAVETAKMVGDPGLRSALESLGQNILSRHKN